MKLDFCPTCGATMKAHTDTHYICINDHHYFNNPRAAVAVILVDDQDNLLFSKRGRVTDPQLGKYDFPGGFVDFGETGQQAAEREMEEELGIKIFNPMLVTTVANRYSEFITTVDIIYICRKWEGKITPTDDVASVAWHPLAFLEGPEFAWPEGYKHLSEILRSILATDSPKA